MNDSGNERMDDVDVDEEDDAENEKEAAEEYEWLDLDANKRADAGGDGGAAAPRNDTADDSDESMQGINRDDESEKSLGTLEKEEVSEMNYNFFFKIIFCFFDKIDFPDEEQVYLDELARDKYRGWIGLEVKFKYAFFLFKNGNDFFLKKKVLA